MVNEYKSPILLDGFEDFTEEVIYELGFNRWSPTQLVAGSKGNVEDGVCESIPRWGYSV